MSSILLFHVDLPLRTNLEIMIYLDKWVNNKFTIQHVTHALLWAWGGGYV